MQLDGPTVSSDFCFRQPRSYPGGGIYERFDHVRLVLQLHDELIYEIREKDLPAVSMCLVSWCTLCNARSVIRVHFLVTPYHFNLSFYSCIHTCYCLVLFHSHAATISHAFLPTISIRLPWLSRSAWKEPSTCVCPWRLRWRQGSRGAHSATTVCPLLWWSQVGQGAFFIPTYSRTVLSSCVSNILRLIV